MAADDLKFTIPNQTFHEVAAAAKTLRILLNNEQTNETMIFTPTLQASAPSSKPKGGTYWQGQLVGRVWRGQPV